MMSTLCKRACSRRSFLKLGAGAAASVPFLASCGMDSSQVAVPQPDRIKNTSNAKVAIARCRTYGREVYDAYRTMFDQLGGIGSLVKGKTVTIKVNLTGRPIIDMFNRYNGESYLTHENTAQALIQILFEEGAKRVRIVESAQYLEPLEYVLNDAGWDVPALKALGNVECENTRNLGFSKTYSTLDVPNKGYFYSAIDYNRSYEDTDVFVSLCKMKNHAVCGVTLSLKNQFGIIPNSLYGDEKGSENALKGRGVIHGWRNSRGKDPIFETPGYKGLDVPIDAGYRVPRVIADINASRPVHLAIIDGITSMSGGEGHWNERLIPTFPGVLIAGLNPVSTDAVGTLVMGYPDPLAPKGTPPFLPGDNHIALAHNCGIGTADLSDIETFGLSIDEARYFYDPTLAMAG